MQNMFVKFGHEICSNRTLCSEFHIKSKKTPKPNKLTDTCIHIICICAHPEMFSFCGSFFYQPYPISFGKIHFAASK